MSAESKKRAHDEPFALFGLCRGCRAFVGLWVINDQQIWAERANPQATDGRRQPDRPDYAAGRIVIGPNAKLQHLFPHDNLGEFSPIGLVSGPLSPSLEGSEWQDRPREGVKQGVVCG